MTTPAEITFRQTLDRIRTESYAINDTDPTKDLISKLHEISNACHTFANITQKALDQRPRIVPKLVSFADAKSMSKHVSSQDENGTRTTVTTRASCTHDQGQNCNGPIIAIVASRTSTAIHGAQTTWHSAVLVKIGGQILVYDSDFETNGLMDKPRPRLTDLRGLGTVKGWLKNGKWASLVMAVSGGHTTHQSEKNMAECLDAVTRAVEAILCVTSLPDPTAFRETWAQTWNYNAPLEWKSIGR